MSRPFFAARHGPHRAGGPAIDVAGASCSAKTRRSLGAAPHQPGWAFGLAALLALGLLAGCGGGGGSEAASGTPPVQGNPPPDPGPVDPLPEPPPPSRLLVVGAVSPWPAGAERVNSLVEVPWASLPPGAEVRLAGGPHTGPVSIAAQGTAERPITLRAADPAQPPVLRQGGLDFQGAAHVQVRGLTVEDSPWGAVVIRRGSHHISLLGNTLRRSYMGVDISDGAGQGLRLEGNLIEDHQTHGIAIVEVNASAAEPGLVLGNTVRRNGHHGLEIHGSHWRIERNEVSASGLRLGGTSGIHLYSRVDDNTCDDNWVRYNFSHSNQDRLLYDGNGIQADHWCDRNVISHNVVWANDGAGIIVFDGADNLVFNNSSQGNGLDPKRRPDQLGEIILNAHLGRTQGNQVFNNLLLPSRREVPGLLVDYLTADRPNSIGPNHHAPRSDGGLLMQRGSRLATSASSLDSLAGRSGHVVEAPRLANGSTPLAHGLRLLRTPSLPGLRPPSGSDMLGVAAQDGMSFFGAYYTAPGLNN